MRRGHAFIDWDDTLAQTLPLFWAAEERISARIAAALGLAPAAVLARGRELDLETARRLGLVSHSFPEAWITCYHEMCARAGRPPEPHFSQSVWDEAAAVYRAPQPLIPGGDSLLRWLREAGFEVTVWTAGDDHVQRAKIERSGLQPLLDRICTVPVKAPDALRAALEGRDPARSFVVGNSRHSDIHPALSLGLFAIHLQGAEWAYDEVHVDREHPDYYAVHHLGEVSDIVRRRFGLAAAGQALA